MNLNNRIRLVVFMGIFAFLFGCGKNNGPTEKPIDNIPETVPLSDAYKPETKPITPIALEEGTHLTGMYLTQQGMARMPYYIMRTTSNGTYMKISDLSPDDYNMWKDDDGEAAEQPSEYFGYIDTVKDVEYASLISLDDESLIRQLEEIIEKYGALGWDGFNESDSMPEVLDSGNRYDLYLELSDGTTVTVNGYNAAPNGFHDFYGEIVNVFSTNSDYSRYLANDFSESPCTYLEVEFREKEHSNVYYLFRLDESMDQWCVVLVDPDGIMFDKGTDISEYNEIEEELPFDRFLTIMSKYNIESWNQYNKTESVSGGAFDITMYFENGKEYYAHGNIYPDGFSEFKEEFLNEIYDFYQEVQPKS